MIMIHHFKKKHSKEKKIWGKEIKRKLTRKHFKIQFLFQAKNATTLNFLSSRIKKEKGSFRNDF